MEYVFHLSFFLRADIESHQEELRDKLKKKVTSNTEKLKQTDSRLRTFKEQYRKLTENIDLKHQNIDNSIHSLTEKIGDWIVKQYSKFSPK